MLASEHHAAELEAMRAPPAPPMHLVKFGSEEVEVAGSAAAENAPDEGGEGGGEDGGEDGAQRCSTAASEQDSPAAASAASSAAASSPGSKTAAELMSHPVPPSSADAAATTTATTTTATATQRPPPPPPPPRPPPLSLPPPEERVVAGCTAVVAAVVQRTVYVANAGDSRAVLCDGAGRARPLSVDHKPAAPAEAARIRAAGGFVSSFGGVARVNGNLSLSRAIGDLQYKGNEALGRHEQVVTVSLCVWGGGSRFFKGSLKRLNQKKKNSLFSPFSLNFNKKKKMSKGRARRHHDRAERRRPLPAPRLRRRLGRADQPGRRGRGLEGAGSRKDARAGRGGAARRVPVARPEGDEGRRVSFFFLFSLSPSLKLSLLCPSLVLTSSFFRQSDENNKTGATT